MSELRVDSVKSKGGGAPNLPKGVTISGIATAATLGATTVDVSNVNVSGVVTSGTLSGSLLSTGTPTLGLGVTINSSGLVISGVATAGIVSATTLYGDGSNLSGIAASISPLFYQPDPGDTGVLLDAGIGITFNQQVKAGSGNVTLRLVGAAGTVVENFGVGSSVTISENRITINPTADLSLNTVYHLSYPSGCFTNNEGTDYGGTAYTFTGRPLNQQLYSWGSNSYGQLGLNQAGGPSNGIGPARSSPTQIPGTSWSNGTRGQRATVITKTDGTLWSWGRNYAGALGLSQPGNTHVSSPTQIGSDTTWSKSGLLANATGFGIKTDGTLWSWGYGRYGMLGQNQSDASDPYASVSSPTQVPGTTWSDAGSIYIQSSWGLKTDGTLWVWGRNNYGQLGLNNRTDYSSPVQIPGTTWTNKIVDKWYGATAVKTDGTLWSWGYSTVGNAGDNTNIKRSSPVQIPGTTWSKVSSSTYTVLATRTDGTLWAWGYNAHGELAKNSVNDHQSSPVQIPGTSWSTPISVGKGALGAIRTDGTLWTWGRNEHGELGVPSVGTANRSSPIQIGSETNWSSDGIDEDPGGQDSGGFLKRTS